MLGITQKHFIRNVRKSRNLYQNLKPITQKLLKEKLYHLVSKYPQSGLYEKNYTQLERTQMFISYVHYLHNELNKKNDSPKFLKIIREFEICTEKSQYDGVWLCDTLLGKQYDHSANHLNKYRYVKNLIKQFEQQTSVDKAGSTYCRYSSIVNNKNITDKKNSIIDEKKLYKIRLDLEKKHDESTVNNKMINIIAKRQNQVDKIQFLEKYCTKEKTLEKLRHDLISDQKYQYWYKLKTIWIKYGFDKIQDCVNNHIIENIEKNKKNGSNFEIVAGSKIKYILNEKYNISIDNIDVLTNVILTFNNKCVGEIDLLSLNKTTNEVLAIIEVKCNIHDISYANKQLIKIFDFIGYNRDRPQYVNYDTIKKIISINSKKNNSYTYDSYHQILKITPFTEPLIFTTIPNKSDNTGLSLENIRAISDLISNDKIIAEIAFDGVCEPIKYDYIWNIMIKILNTNKCNDYDSPVNMVKQFNDCLIVSDE
jgi:hypothetical protein